MSVRQLYRVGRRLKNESVMLQRMAERWLATGTVPVAYIVADLNEPDDTSAMLAGPPGIIPSPNGILDAFVFEGPVPC
jgi:hypothetical protein